MAQGDGAGTGAGPAVEAFVARLSGRPWSQTVVADDGIPATWQALRGGVHLRIMSVPPVRDLWVLPADWVGFQAVAVPFDLMRRDGVLIAMRAEERPSHVRELLDGLPGEGGRVLAAHVPQEAPPFATPASAAAADRHASELCARQVTTAVGRGAAITSFAALDIPAVTVFTQTVRDEDLQAATAAISILAHHGGDAAVAALLPTLGLMELTQDGIVRQREVAWGLAQIATPECGPVLLDDFAHLQDSETRESVVQALERIAYQPAAPAVLRMLEKTEDPYLQARYAKVLASLRYAPAVPAVARICRSAHPDADILMWDKHWLGGERPEIALLRLTASWGQPTAGVRLLLLPYARTVSGKGCRIALLIENLGGREADAMRFMQGCGDSAFVIDGVDHPDTGAAFDGCFTIRQHGTWVEVCTLAAAAIKPGRHRLSYHAGVAVANEVVIDVVAAP